MAFEVYFGSNLQVEKLASSETGGWCHTEMSREGAVLKRVERKWLTPISAVYGCRVFSQQTSDQINVYDFSLFRWPKYLLVVGRHFRRDF